MAVELGRGRRRSRALKLRGAAGQSGRIQRSGQLTKRTRRGRFMEQARPHPQT
jgi:hypothetical protein